jgi:hypothetical protein
VANLPVQHHWSGRRFQRRAAEGELRRVLYDLLERSLEAAGIGRSHLEGLADRGDGVLILIRPHDDVPKTVLFGRLIPTLTTLVAWHNATAARPELRARLGVVVHAGEVHDDGRGFYGDDLDVAFRLLNSRTVKRCCERPPRHRSCSWSRRRSSPGLSGTGMSKAARTSNGSRYR